MKILKILAKFAFGIFMLWILMFLYLILKVCGVAQEW